MDLNKKFTDNELWEMLDGQLPETQARLVQQAIRADSKLAAQLARVRAARAAFLATPPARPGPDFSRNLMARLAADGLVLAPKNGRPDWLVRGGLAGFGLILLILVVAFLQNLPTEPVFTLPDFEVPTGWLAIFQQKTFLWMSWLAFLVPALFLLERKLVERGFL